MWRYSWHVNRDVKSVDRVYGPRQEIASPHTMGQNVRSRSAFPAAMHSRDWVFLSLLHCLTDIHVCNVSVNLQR